MANQDWEAHYAQGETPWDTNEPDPHLVELVRSGVIPKGRALDIGCGTGTNVLWLAAQGFDVMGVDVSSRAIEMAKAKSAGAEGRFSFATHDILAAEVPSGPFDFVFDRGCFHVFDEPADRARFAERVAAALRPGGQWLSIMGSTEGPPRDHGPPRRSVRDIANAIEPSLEIVSLRASEFDADLPTRARAWVCLARRRTEPAQPSTRRD